MTSTRLLAALLLAGAGDAASAQCELTTDVKFGVPVFQFQQQFGAAVALDGDVLVVGAPGAFGGGSAHVFRYDGVSWVPDGELVPTLGESFDRFGEAVAVDGGVIAVGAPRVQLGTGMVVVYRYDGASWNEEQTLVPPEVDDSDWFGASVAVEGGWLVGGAPRENCGPSGDECGAAYVFEHNGSGWVETQELTGGILTHGNAFGDSMSLEDGTLVVGAPRNEGIPMPAGTGQADVFRFDGASWTNVGTLIDPALPLEAGMGEAVGVSGVDVLVGAPGDDFGGFTDAGSVYFFEESGAAWSQIGNPPGPDPQNGGGFATSVAVKDGLAVAGAPARKHAMLYRKSGGAWKPLAKLVPTGPSSGFGRSVAIDGGFVVVGADLGGSGGAGQVHVFEVPELLLEVTPPSAGPGQIVSLDSCGGAPGGLDAIVVTEIGGTPTQLVLFTGTFDIEGQTSFAVPVPPGLTGLTAELVSYGHYLPGVAGVSDPVTFTFL